MDVSFDKSNGEPRSRRALSEAEQKLGAATEAQARV